MQGWREPGWPNDITNRAVQIVTFVGVLSALAAVWWACSVAVLFLSVSAALVHPARKRAVRRAGELPPLTAIAPIKDLHAGFEEALHSLFAQAYDGMEIVVASAERESPAIEAARQIQKDFPRVPSRLLQSRLDRAASPKLNSLWPAIVDARYDHILTKDSNLALEARELEDLVYHLGADVGLVSSLPIAVRPESFPAWIEASIINCYHARVLLMGRAAGFGFGLGKVMLFRRSDLMRAGGFESLAWALGEDMALARAVGRLGLRTVLADRFSHQILGRRHFSQVWQRQLRWMVIWRVQLPAAFVADMGGSALPTALAGAAGAWIFGFAPAGVAAMTLAIWFALESLLCIARGWPISFWSPLAFVGREILTPLLWLRACTTADVEWGGTLHRVAAEPRFADSAHSPAAPLPARDFDK